MRMSNSSLEQQRSRLQKEFDAGKSQKERNLLGQFATPFGLAKDILTFARRSFSKKGSVKFLDPAFGTGVFYSALLDVFPSAQIKSASGYEIDPELARLALEIWSQKGLQLDIEDFTAYPPPKSRSKRANLVICNPPYVRHHHIPLEEKKRLSISIEKNLDLKLNGLAGLYCYFILLCHEWLSKDGLAGWLIPTEFMDVRYGNIVKKYLLEYVDLFRIHTFDSDDVQFTDALVSSSIIWFRKHQEQKNSQVQFSFGGSLLDPMKVRHLSKDELKGSEKWSQLGRLPRKATDNGHIKLGELFKIQRGLATGKNSFFILPKEEAEKRNLPFEFLKPILPSPRHLQTDRIQSDENGFPVVSPALVLLDCKLPENEIQTQYPNLWKYLREGIEAGVHEGYLCGRRTPWYSQEKRPPAPILCTYMGRINSAQKRLFRFILNQSEATTHNVYLMCYPKPELDSLIRINPDLLIEVWNKLREIPIASLIREGRVYGGGLYKLEPRELSNVPADEVMKLLYPNSMNGSQ